MKKKTVQFCKKNLLCCSCGFCADVCPVNAIRIAEQNFIFSPLIDKTKCIHCGLCYDICAGKGNDWYAKTSLRNQSQKEKGIFVEDIGFHTTCYAAHATDYETRFHSASGGIVTTLLLQMLEKQQIQGAVVTRFVAEKPLEVETVIATTVSEIVAAQSSKYCPVHMDGILRQLKEFNGKVAFVGLPCQIQTLQNIAVKQAWVQEKIHMYIGLFCSGTKDSRALDFLLKKNGIAKEGMTKFAFRDDGCLGNVKATYGTNGANYTFVPFVKAYSILHSYFKPERCVSCIDHFSFFADISVGDIDCAPYNNDTIGSNSVIVRTDKAKELLLSAVCDHAIEATEIPASEILRSQSVLFFRKSLFFAYRFMQKICFRPVPSYDRLPKAKLHLKGILWAFSYKAQRFLSKMGVIR